MNTFEKLMKNYVNLGREKERKIGRYWASELEHMRLLDGTTIEGTKKEEKFEVVTPANFFDTKPELTLKQAKRVIVGQAVEEMWWKVFKENKIDIDRGEHLKREIKIDREIVLVVIPDFEAKDFVMEMKSPQNPDFTKIPAWYYYQLEAEYRATYKKVYLALAPIEPLTLKTFRYEPLKSRWTKIISFLTEFHKQLKGRHKNKK